MNLDYDKHIDYKMIIGMDQIRSGQKNKQFIRLIDQICSEQSDFE